MMKMRRRILRIAAVGASTALASAAALAQVIPQVPMPAEAGSDAGTAAHPAMPPNTYVVPSIAVLGTATSNADLGTGAASRSDQTLELIPRVFLISDHARWRLNADLGADALYYAHGSQPNSFAPNGNASLHSELVDRFLYFDASMNAQQESISPYVGQGGPLSSSSYTSEQLRISPYIDRLLRPGLRLRARSDDTWTHASNSSGNVAVSGGRYLDQSIDLTQQPTAWGYTLTARQIYSTYTGQPYAWMRDTTGRVVPQYALSQRLIVGLIGGREKVQVHGDQDTAPIYGAMVRWRPRPGDGVQASFERRFFGAAWKLQADGGTPLLRLHLDWYRDIGSELAPLGSSSSGAGNVTQLLDGLFSTQYPNPLQRAQVVQALLGEAGLPPGLPTSGNFYTSSSMLQNSLIATGVLLHERDNFALSVYRNRTADLFLPGQQALALLQGLSNDNLQTGAAFNYGHRLTPLDTLNLTLQREDDTGFGPNQGRNARLTALIAQLDHRFSPRTIGLLGVRRRLLVSSEVGNSNETALFAGLVHRF